MNYRHAFHAGSFADVVKHAALVRVLAHLRDKPAAFRVIDTHAGAGLYDLAGAEAARTGEWRNGIGRLRAAALSEPAAALLRPYLDAVASCNPGNRFAVYPGSPALARMMLRPQDRLLACELEPQAAARLAASMRGDARAKAIAIDGWTALTAYVPPRERRGLVLIDPPFEEEDDFARLVHGLAAAHRKWATGIFMLWYPVKDDAAVTGLIRRLTRLGIAKTLRAELIVASATEAAGLRGTGLIVVNPPWKLMDELAILLPALGDVLRRDTPSRHRLQWLTGERAP